MVFLNFFIHFFHLNKSEWHSFFNFLILIFIYFFHLNKSEWHGDNTEAEIRDCQVGDEHIPENLIVGFLSDFYMEKRRFLSDFYMEKRRNKF